MTPSMHVPQKDFSVRTRVQLFQHVHPQWITGDLELSSSLEFMELESSKSAGITQSEV